MKKIYVCPWCHSFFASENEADVRRCPECSANTQETDIDFESFSELTAEERENVKKDYIATHFSDKVQQPSVKEEAVPNQENVWASILKGIFGFSLVVSVIAGLIVMGTVGFGVGIACVVGGIVGCGGGLLVCTVAEDIRHIRNQVDRFMFENKKAE